MRQKLEKIRRPYAKQALWFLENVYGPNRGLLSIAARSHFSGATMKINPKFDLNRLDSKVRNYIIQRQQAGSQSPVTLQYAVRISDFAYKLTGPTGATIQLNFPASFIEDFISKTNIKVTLAADSGASSILSLFESQKLSAENIPTNLKLISFARMQKKLGFIGSKMHDAQVDFSLTRVGDGIVIELPVYDPTTRRLAGHIDLLVMESDGHLVVWDYKPPHQATDWSPDPSAPVAQSFIQFLPQVAAYALTLMHQLGLKDVSCGMYNEKGSWEFDPSKVMMELNAYFPTAPFPWRHFQYLGI